MTSYSFTTILLLDAPLSQVWDVLLDYSKWPSWWKGIHDLSVDRSGKFPIVTVKLGYLLYALSLTLTNEKLETLKEISFRSSGDLEGTGVFILKKEERATLLSFDWNVTTMKPWMNTLAPLARPFFCYSHNHIMEWFAKGLAKELNAILVRHEYRTNK